MRGNDRLANSITAPCFFPRKHVTLGRALSTPHRWRSQPVSAYYNHYTARLAQGPFKEV
jgi:hypothetical protein